MFSFMAFVLCLLLEFLISQGLSCRGVAPNVFLVIHLFIRPFSFVFHAAHRRCQEYDDCVVLTESRWCSRSDATERSNGYDDRSKGRRPAILHTYDKIELTRYTDWKSC